MDSIKCNITAIGEQIKGKNVQLTASNTINLEAGSNTQRVETNSKSSGWNVSANIGMRTGGPVLIGYLAKDLYMDYQVYSGRELAKAWGADLIPVATGLGGGLVGSSAGPVGAFAVGIAGATFGDRIKDEIKFNLKKDVDK